jgi:hypothetical protein
MLCEANQILGRLPREPVACARAFIGGGVVSLCTVGTPLAYRRWGIATQMARHALEAARHELSQAKRRSGFSSQTYMYMESVCRSRPCGKVHKRPSALRCTLPLVCPLVPTLPLAPSEPLSLHRAGTGHIQGFHLWGRSGAGEGCGVGRLGEFSTRRASYPQRRGELSTESN